MASVATMRMLLRGESELSPAPTDVAHRRRPLSHRHGQRLSCFRSRARFTLRPTPTSNTNKTNKPNNSTVCACANEPLPCRLAGDARTLDTSQWLAKCDALAWPPSVYQQWRSPTPTPTPAPTPTSSVLSSLANFAEPTPTIDALLRAGVPPQHRGRVWWRCSGAAEKRATSTAAETYGALLRQLPMLSKRAALEIEKDLPRTFPVTDAFPITRNEQDVTNATTAELRRVLQAYSLRNPSVGYCQSMNFVAAVLLQYLDEEAAFWVLTALVEDLIPQFHARSMVGSRAEQRVFTELVQLHLPRVYAHMNVLGVDLEPFTLKWFLCLFLNTLPLEPAMRVWDVFFCHGRDVLLRVGLTLLKLCEPRILASDDPIDVYELFKFSYESLVELTAPHRSLLFNYDECVCDTLMRLAMDTSFVGALPVDSLGELRLLYRNEVAAELKAADERRALRRKEHEEEEEEEEDEAAFHQRHADAAAELQEYDFVEEYAYHIGDVSPSKHISFGDSTRSLLAVGESLGDDEAFVDVEYGGVR